VTTRVRARGLGIDLVRGWEAEIRPVSAHIAASTASTDRPPDAVLHAANFALPPVRGEFGAGAVEVMRSGHAFVAVVEYGAETVGLPLFDHPRPSGLLAADIDEGQLQRWLPGHAGCQRFFSEAGRAFCLYVVLSGPTVRRVLVPRVNEVLATVTVDPR
jgi:hypothetical protein